MKWDYFFHHRNPQLLRLTVIQAFLMTAVFSLFFYSTGFTFYYAILAGLACFLAIAALFKFLNLPFFILPGITGPVFLPTQESQLQTMVELAQIKPGQRVIDLGAGDGRVVAAFAAAGAKAVGVELNPDMVQLAEERLAVAKLKDAEVRWESLWEADLAPYDVVVIYGVPAMMKEVGRKCQRELRPGAKVISNHYPIPGWQPVKTENRVYLYQIKATKSE